MAKEVTGWNELGVVGTIYEEEEEEEEYEEEEYAEENDSFSSSSSSVPSLDLSPYPTTWKLSRRNGPDVVIHVHDSCFRLHKDALISKSAYLRRKLAEFSEIALSPPLNITPQTFSMVTEFCYGDHVEITPSNVAALMTAAELLGMTETHGPGDQNLLQITEEYFRCEVAGNVEHLSVVLRSCFPLLPEAETALFLLSRCIEALSLTNEIDGDLSCLDGFCELHVEDFQLILESISQRLTNSHDLLYRIIDIFLKENMETLSDDHKIQMCNYIDCSILSPKLLMDAVQNPRMPLRFVVQAMFLQQLNTRHNIIAATSEHLTNSKKHDEDQKDSFTLGAILQRDAALRQVSQLKAVMSVTNSRIQTLEKELSGMRKLIDESGSVKDRVGSGRSESFRLSSDNSNKMERGQRGSVSALSLRNVKSDKCSFEESSSEGCPKVEKSFRQRLVSGLKSVIGLQKKKRGGGKEVDGVKNREVLDGGDGNQRRVVIIKKDRAFLKRSNSQS